MKRLSLLLPLLILLLLPCRGAVPDYTYGSMLPLKVPEAPAWPEGFDPFYVNHTGRHGARYMSSEKKARGLYETLEKASSAKALTPKGKALLALTQQVMLDSQGKWGALTSLGRTQERQIASFTLACMDESMEQGRAEASATYVPRVVMSMYEFCYSLALHTSRLEVSTAEGREFSPLLRFFAVDDAYVELLKSVSLKSLEERSEEAVVPVAPAEALFTRGYIMSARELRRITMEAYGVLQALPAMELYGDPTEWFTPAEFTACWRQDNYVHWLERTGAYSQVPLKSARPLLRAIVEELDKAASGRAGELRATLRFGHAETLMPLLALMRVPGMCWQSPASAIPDAEVVSTHWRDSNVVPLGAFMQVQLARDGRGDVYARVVVNGRVTHEPVLWSVLRKELIND